MSVTYGKPRVKISVLVDGKKSGEIRSNADGYWYVPTGQTEGGEIFNQIARVKSSLERKS